MTPSKQRLLYYSLFILAYTLLYFISSFYLMNYEDNWDGTRMGDIWTLQSMKFDEKIAYILMSIFTFPLGIIVNMFFYGVFNLIVICILNPLFIAGIMEIIFRRARTKFRKYSIILNSIIAASAVVFILLWTS